MARTMPTARRKAGYTDAGASTPKPTASQQKQLDRYEAEDRSKAIMSMGAKKARASLAGQKRANGGGPGPFNRLLNALDGK